MKLPFYDWYRNLIRNSPYRWVIILGTIAYLVSPIDLLPDFIPLIGQIDDTVVVGLLVAELSTVLIDRMKKAKPPTDIASAEGTPKDTVDVDATKVG